MLAAFVWAILLVSPQGIAEQPVSAELDAIYRQYMTRPGVGGLVDLDRRIRKLLEEPWRQDRRSIDGKLYRPAWSNIGVWIGHYSDTLGYSGKLLVEAHALDPRSEFRRFTLFAAIMGVESNHGLGEMPNVETARQYLKEFPDGPFARDTAIILGDFYSDLFKVVKEVEQKQPRGYKYDCFRKYLQKTTLASQAQRARRLSVRYYNRALERAPAAWQESTELRLRRAAMQSGDPESIDRRGWHFCAD